MSLTQLWNEYLQVDKEIHKDSVEDLDEIIELLRKVPNCEVVHKAISRLCLLRHHHQKLSNKRTIESHDQKLQ